MAVGKVVDYDTEREMAIIHFPVPLSEWIRKGFEECEVLLHDGRSISPRQRGKIRALISDICEWAGYETRYDADNINDTLKASYCALTGNEQFSLADCDMSTARGYINYLIEFVLANDIPCLDSILNRTDDLNATLYACLFHKKCVVCGKKASVHHVDTVGMGRDREHIVHVGMRAMALCDGPGGHHDEAHKMGVNSFNEKYHVYGIELDKILVKQLRLGDTSGIKS